MRDEEKRAVSSSALSGSEVSVVPFRLTLLVPLGSPVVACIGAGSGTVDVALADAAGTMVSSVVVRGLLTVVSPFTTGFSTATTSEGASWSAAGAVARTDGDSAMVWM
jgi:hypothetical protein